MKKLLLLLLALGVFAGMDAQKTKKKNPPKKAKTYVNTLTPVPADSASYAIGVLQAASLKQYLMQTEGVDSAYVEVALSALTSNLRAEEVDRLIAFASGLKIARMNVEMAPRFNQQLTGKADTTYLNVALMNQALIDVNTGKATMLTPEQAMSLMERQEKFVAEGMRLENQKWLDENAQKEGVVTTESGLQYKVLVQGTGEKATKESMVEVHYEGSLIDGSNCYDEEGEENYRGPHGVSIIRCKNIICKGYCIQHTGNWSHNVVQCSNLTVENITVKAGHDGVHMTVCENIKIK